jgi:hypothetical protein
VALLGLDMSTAAATKATFQTMSSVRMGRECAYFASLRCSSDAVLHTASRAHAATLLVI